MKNILGDEIKPYTIQTKICKYCKSEINAKAKVCPVCRKTLNFSIARVLVAILLIFILVPFLYSLFTIGYSPLRESSNNISRIEENLKLSEYQMKKDEYNFQYIEGTIRNDGNSTYAYVQVQFNAYDKDGNHLGTFIDNTNQLETGRTWKFKAMFVGTEEVASYTFSGITGW
jgi:hypothetical protein